MNIEIDTDAIARCLPLIIVVCIVMLAVLFAVCELAGARFWVT